MYKEKNRRHITLRAKIKRKTGLQQPPINLILVPAQRRRVVPVSSRYQKNRLSEPL